MTQKATFAAGCFWCTEAIFKRLKGINSITSGYAGGDPPAHSGLSSGLRLRGSDSRRSKTGGENPSYDQVSTGATGHAEAIQIEFDPEVVPYERLLDIFFATHDPTTKNQQGADIGTQYRSVIFYHTEKQEKAAKEAKNQREKEGKYNDPIVTEIVPFEHFYKAEDYHQNYYDANRSYPYCTVVIDPKIRKLLEEFRKDVKKEYQNS